MAEVVSPISSTSTTPTSTTSSSQTTDSNDLVPLQFITVDEKFQPVINKCIAHHLNKGIDYHTMSILGCQSTGKSTLLNRLFGTNFEILTRKGVRKRTTEGLWISTTKSTQKPIIIIDIEGTDSASRGVEHAQFERKAALFSLAVSEVLVINLLDTDIGRQNGSNYTLLQTVFEVHLALFHQMQSTKTHILFVIRDFDDDNDFELVASQIKGDLNKIWSNIRKPDNLSQAQKDSILESFTISVYALRHFKLQKKLFEIDVEELQPRFFEETNPNYLFSPSNSKTVPIDGFQQYAKQIWATILENKDIDIPSQRQMLSLFRCEEFATTALAMFEKIISPHRKTLKQQATIIENPKKLFSDAISKAINYFDSCSSKYHPVIVKESRHKLETNLSSQCFALFSSLMILIVDQFTSEFEKNLKGLISQTQNGILKNFNSVVEEVVADAQSDYVLAKASSTPDNITWDCADIDKTFELAISGIIEEIRSSQMTFYFEKQKTIISNTLEDPLFRVLHDGNPDTMWKSVSELIQKLINPMKPIFTKTLVDSYSCSNEVVLEWETKFETSVVEIVKAQISDFNKNLYDVCKLEFEKSFSRDSSGRPRQWVSLSETDKYYFPALNRAIRVLNSFVIFQLNPSVRSLIEQSYEKQVQLAKKKAKSTKDSAHNSPELLPLIQVPPQLKIDNPQVILLQHQQLQSIYKRLISECESSYLQIQQIIQSRNSIHQIPGYFWIIFLIFAADEIWAVLTNPLLFILTLILGIGLFLLYKTGNLSILILALDPIMKRVSAVATVLMQPNLANVEPNTVPITLSKSSSAAAPSQSKKSL